MLWHSQGMQKDSRVVAHSRLKSLRASRLLTQKEVAKYGEFKLDSNYRYYENKFRDEYLPQRIRDQIFRALLGHGTPPIQEHEISSLFYPQPEVKVLYPDQFNATSSEQKSPQSGIINGEADASIGAIDIKDLVLKAFTPLTTHEIENLVEEGQVMKGHDIRYGQIIAIEDDSMMPELPCGIRVVCDPAAELENGCYVFAHMNNMRSLVCRRYTLSIEDGVDKVIRLTALNDAFDSYLIDKNMQGHVVGRVVFAFKYF